MHQHLTSQLSQLKEKYYRNPFRRKDFHKAVSVFGKKGHRALPLYFLVNVFEQVTEIMHIRDTCVQDYRQSQEMTERTPGIEFISINFTYVEVRHLKFFTLVKWI